MSTAVLVIDMQNGFVHPEGSLPQAGLGQPNTPQVIAENAALLEEARRAGLPVIYTRHVYRADFIDMPERNRRDIPLDPPPLVKGSWDGDVHDDVQPMPGDNIIDKNRYDAFLYTDLEVVLRALGVKRLLVTGVVTSICVESTVRSGHQRDFEMFVASDCVSAPETEHEAALNIMARMFADVGPWRELLPAVIGEKQMTLTA
ncbi:cysteine hydrolase family protein [Citricoccus sp. GCM10030269]|uniref:cysteine hydrolase family protein n=1 Tax=Citricoccus sp. GCM10030269 TaxID=3273388 RepID=UPI00360B2F4A